MENPWELAYKLYGERYTVEQIDEMTFAEICELINAVYDPIEKEENNEE